MAFDDGSETVPSAADLASSFVTWTRSSGPVCAPLHSRRQPGLGGFRLEDVEAEALDRADRARALQRAGGCAVGAPGQDACGEVVDVHAGEADL
jgi:hypothetical protein